MVTDIRRHVDLLIVGGGPAGVAAALRTKQVRPDWSVVILDKDEFPRDKVCGDGLGPHAITEIVLLGAHAVLEGHPPILRTDLQGPSGARVSGISPRPGFVIRRKELDSGLVNAARSCGVEVFHERVDQVHIDQNGVTVNDSWDAPFVIAADGANSRCRRLLKLSSAEGNDLAFAARGYMPTQKTELRIRWEKKFAPSYSWAFPLGDGYANVGFGCLKNQLPKNRSKDALWEALEETTGLPSNDPTIRAHHLPLSSAKLQKTFERVLFVGDAAGFINPLSDEGIYYALASGRVAANALIANDPPQMYAKAIDREFRAHFRATSILAKLARHIPGSFDATIRAARSNQETFDDLLELTLGNGTLTAGILRDVVKSYLPGHR